MTRNRHIQLLTIELVKTHSYEQARGLLLGTTYSDDTTAQTYTYNHLGQITHIVDDAGTRTIGYNAYNEQESDSLLAGGKTHLVTELRDDYGRSSGYTYANNGSVQQTVNVSFVHNSRSELASAVVCGATYGYDYDNIGTRRMAMEASDYTLYEANNLNQYTSSDTRIKK